MFGVRGFWGFAFVVLGFSRSGSEFRGQGFAFGIFGVSRLGFFEVRGFGDFLILGVHGAGFPGSRCQVRSSGLRIRGVRGFAFGV